MHAQDQHLLVIGAVEDADVAALRQVAGGAPEEIVLQLLGARMLVAEHLATLRIDAGHHVPDGAVLARRVHRLEDEQHGVAVGAVEQLLLIAQAPDVIGQHLVILVLRLVNRFHARRPFLQLDRVAFAHAEIVGIDFHEPAPGGIVVPSRNSRNPRKFRSWPRFGLPRWPIPRRRAKRAHDGQGELMLARPMQWIHCVTSSDGPEPGFSNASAP